MPFAPEDHSELGIFQLRYSIVPRVGAVIHEGQAYRLERRCRPHFYHVFRVGRQEARQAGLYVGFALAWWMGRWLDRGPFWSQHAVLVTTMAISACLTMPAFSPLLCCAVSIPERPVPRLGGAQQP